MSPFFPRKIAQFLLEGFGPVSPADAQKARRFLREQTRCSDTYCPQLLDLAFILV
jgi:hypothetical protein